MQVIIDSCKRLYEIDGVKEIDRISKLPCMSMKKEVIDKNGNKRMKKCDFPEFMKYTREIAVTKDGKELPQEDIEESKNKLKGRINKDLVCPMNWLQEWLDVAQFGRAPDLGSGSLGFKSLHSNFPMYDIVFHRRHGVDSAYR